MGLVILEIELLEIKRSKLCNTFAKKTLQSRHSDIFTVNPNQHYARNKPEFFVNKCHTKDFITHL